MVVPAAHATGMNAKPCAMLVSSVISVSRRFMGLLGDVRDNNLYRSPPIMLFMTPTFPFSIPTRLRLECRQQTSSSMKRWLYRLT